MGQCRLFASCRSDFAILVSAICTAHPNIALHVCGGTQAHTNARTRTQTLLESPSRSLQACSENCGKTDLARSHSQADSNNLVLDRSHLGQTERLCANAPKQSGQHSEKPAAMFTE